MPVLPPSTCAAARAASSGHSIARAHEAAHDVVGLAHLVLVRALDEPDAQLLEPRDRRIGADQHERGVVRVALLRAVAERDRHRVVARTRAPASRAWP